MYSIFSLKPIQSYVKIFLFNKFYLKIIQKSCFCFCISGFNSTFVEAFYYHDMRYSMTQVEVLTGIKSNTLRIWERRYNILTPNRTDTNIRFYTDEDLKKLLNISILLKSGYRISKIDKMCDDEIWKNVLSVTDVPEDYASLVSKLVLYMVDLDELKFLEVIEQSIEKIGVFETVKCLLYPFLNHIGILWTVNKMTPAKEHFVSNLIRQKIIAETDKLKVDYNSGKSAMLFLPENEDHELALILANYILRVKGYRTYYLGQNVPIENISELIEKAPDSVLLTMNVTRLTEDNQMKLEQRLLALGRPVYIFGNLNLDLLSKEITYLSSPDELFTTL